MNLLNFNLTNQSFFVQAYSSLGQDGPTSDLFQSETVLNVAKSLDRTIRQVYILFIEIILAGLSSLA